MFQFKSIATIVLAACTIAIAPAHAANSDIVVTGHPTFRDLEFDYAGADRVAAARASFAAMIPVGTDTGTARAIVRKQGAHCGVQADNGETRCTFGSFDSVEDHEQDIQWKVTLDSHAGQIADLSVTREARGA